MNLLLETGDALLTEDGFHILLEGEEVIQVYRGVKLSGGSTFRYRPKAVKKYHTYVKFGKRK